ncbi:FGGY family carbohydrate kinase [Longimicrobium sp.]|uniref:FGGY family carbohydrate kinase n=1 Tax=Longimicrobium sp. TaxID=2029185 RepID=UPI002B5C7987|nr:FGGY family carbohydrate kinase [Longimicrobium sp.]HSU16385.1 FGGY family carbohydrate kinase [Longimicrobium sp.]
MSKRHVLAMDIGSSSVRAQVYDARGRAAGAGAQVPVRWRTHPRGAMEADADTLVRAALTALDRATKAARAAKLEIAAVAIDTFWHGVMGVDADGRTLTPLYAWGDTRARDAAARLRERVDAEAAHGRTGCFVHESYPAAKLVWLRQMLGDTFPRAAAWLSIGEHLGERLSGVRRTSLSMASATGLLDVRECRWDAEMLAACGITGAHLPELSDEPVRGLLPPFARRWPELAGVPWFPALGDGACATVGSGAAKPGRLALTVGTSAAVRVLREDAEPRVPDGLWLYRVDARRTVAGRAISNGGNTFAWLRRTLRLPRPDRLEAMLASAADEPAPHLRAIPTLLGERPPLSERGEAATFAGMTMDTTPVDLWRAWLWAVAGRVADAVAAVEGEYGRADEIVASGGALHASASFRRILERALGRPITLRDDGNDTARGAALVALERIRG